MSIINLKPNHKHGFTNSYIEELFSPETLKKFRQFIARQTCVRDNGETVYFTDDVFRFVNNFDIVD